jgi:hypothetical protein
VLGEEATAGPREDVTADRREAEQLVEVHVVRHADPILADPDEVQTVLLPFTGTTPARRRSAGLHDDDAAFTVEARVEIQRVADIGTVQVPAEHQLDPEIGEAVDGAFRARHDIAALVVGRGREVVVRDDDPRDARRRILERAGAELQLPAVDTAIDQGTQRLGRVERDDHRIFQPVHRVQFLSRCTLCTAHKVRRYAFEHTIQRHVMVAGHHHEGQRWQPVEECACLRRTARDGRAA